MVDDPALKVTFRERTQRGRTIEKCCLISPIRLPGSEEEGDWQGMLH